jgi:DNA-directed RNA polymerase subunit RPC12/RpoP
MHSMKKPKDEVWYGCARCSYVPPLDRSRSTPSWRVYKSGRCPHCGHKMKFNIGDRPKGGKK